MGQGALAGLRSIEMGQLIAGPFCGQLMADHGAEVIKIEAPGAPDPIRLWGQGAPVWFPVIGRGKKCITLDLRQPEGQAVVRRLAQKSDFLVENFRPGTLEKWNLAPALLQDDNPALIVVRVSGYGQTGPYAERAGYGSVGEAMGGLRALAGDPSAPPSRVGISIGDALAATYGLLGALMALNVRHRTGRGQIVDSAIYEAVLAMMECTVAEYTEAGHIRSRTGAILPGLAPSNVYPTADGEILIAANSDPIWKRFCAAMGREEFADDPRYATHLARGERQAELDALISTWTPAYASEELLARLAEHAVPAGKIYTAPDMLADPHFAAREALRRVEHPTFANLWMQTPTPKLSATPGSIAWPGPEPGAHNEEIYGHLLGMGAAERAGLAARGVI